MGLSQLFLESRYLLFILIFLVFDMSSAVIPLLFVLLIDDHLLHPELLLEPFILAVPSIELVIEFLQLGREFLVVDEVRLDDEVEFFVLVGQQFQVVEVSLLGEGAVVLVGLGHEQLLLQFLDFDLLVENLSL